MDQNNTRVINNRSNVIEIDLLELFGVLLSKIWIILGCSVGAALATFLVTSYLITPEYESTTKMYVINQQNRDSLTYSDLQSGTQLTKDYQELVTSRPVLEEVSAELNLQYTDAEFKKKISVSVPTDTRIVSMTVNDEDPYMARAIADRLRISASKHIADVMNTEAVNVVEEANLPLEPASPLLLRDTVVGGLLGAFISIFIILFIYVMDDTIKNPDDVEKYLHSNVLGSIPLSSTSGARRGKRSKKAGESDHSHSIHLSKETAHTENAIAEDSKHDYKSEVNQK